MRTSVLLVAAAALVLAAAPAFAQPEAPQPGMANGQGHAHHGDHKGGGEWRAKFAAKRQQRMQDLHTVLRIRPEQDGAWQAYQAALTPPEHARGERMQQPQGAQTPQTTPQMLDRMAAWQAKREQRMVARTEATKRFYAALSPEQQQTFDALRRLARGRRGGFGGRGGHGRMGGMEQRQG